MSKIYCPYTDKYIEYNMANSEHIIPLSLGGANGFEILVDRQFNLDAGSKIDGKLANDFLINLKRTKHRVKGHSNREPTIVAKQAIYGSEEIKVRLEMSPAKGVKIWDPVKEKSIDFFSSVKFSNTSNINEGRINRIRFIAKTALSSGYFFYGSKFISSTKHEELRTIMNHANILNDPRIKKLETTVDYQFSDDKNPIIQAFKFVCSSIDNASCVGLIPLQNTLAIFIGILGGYIGMVNVPCESITLLEIENRKWGAFVCFQEGRPITCSWHRLVTRIGEELKRRQKNLKRR